MEYFVPLGLLLIPLREKTDEPDERRQTICGKIYPKSGPLPESGEELSLWMLRLLKVRQAFFQELVHQGILDPFYPDPKSPKTRGAI